MIELDLGNDRHKIEEHTRHCMLFEFHWSIEGNGNSKRHRQRVSRRINTNIRGQFVDQDVFIVLVKPWKID